MGWIWKEVKHEDGEECSWNWEDLGDGVKPVWGGFTSPDGIKTVVKSEWTHEKLEDGNYLRKSNNVRQIIKMTRGKPEPEVLESKSYYTEEVVTEEEYKNGPTTSFPLTAADVPRVRVQERPRSN